MILIYVAANFLKQYMNRKDQIQPLILKHYLFGRDSSVDEFNISLTCGSCFFEIAVGLKKCHVTVSNTEMTFVLDMEDCSVLKKMSGDCVKTLR